MTASAAACAGQPDCAVPALMDALTHAEAERDEAWRVAAEQTRLERDRAEQAEAEREALSVALLLAETGEEVQTSERYSNAVALAHAVRRADQAEARIKAVQAALHEWEAVKHTQRMHRDITDALEGDR